MEKNYNDKVSKQEIENKESIMNALKRLLGTDKEKDIHGLSEFAWP